MDIVLELADYLLFDRLYATLLPRTSYEPRPQPTPGTSTFSSRREAPTLPPSSAYQPTSQFLNLGLTSFANRSDWPRDFVVRQAVSLFLITWVFGIVLYFVFSTLSYLLVFDKQTFQHPKYLKNQVRQEIAQTLASLPGMAVLTMPFFLAEVRGYAKLYEDPADAPFALYNVLQFPLFILFTDFFIYWIHRGLHHPKIYKTLHKPHHRWIMPTPYASHAFHALDGFSQSVPYHVYPFIFPLNKYAYILLFLGVNVWTILIHDGEYVANSPVLNGAACHTMHHLYFNYNYGQFTTLWDRMGGSYRPPNAELFNKEAKMSNKEWQKQCSEMEVVQRVVEGQDDRQYGAETEQDRKKRA